MSDDFTIYIDEASLASARSAAHRLRIAAELIAALPTMRWAEVSAEWRGQAGSRAQVAIGSAIAALRRLEAAVLEAEQAAARHVRAAEAAAIERGALVVPS